MYNVLLADDDERVRNSFRKMNILGDCGFILSDEASNGKQASELISIKKYDLVITDICMPFVNGIDLLRLINEKSPETCVMLISVHSEFEYVRQGFLNNASDYLLKPLSEDLLRDSLNRIGNTIRLRRSMSSESNIVRRVFDTYNIDCGGGVCGRLYAYLSDNLGRNISMDETASAMGLSKDYFGKTIKQQTGMSFNTLYKLIKIEYAKYLMDNESYKNYEISEMPGYSTPDYFSRIFKEVTGLLPSEYKNGA